MRAILIDDDPVSQQHWLDRLSFHQVETTVVTNELDWDAACQRSDLSAALCRLTASNHDELARRIKPLLGRCSWVLAIIPSQAEIAKVAGQIYNCGFHDFIADDCGDEVLAAKLAHGEHLGNLERCLAQAQKLESIGELAAGIAHEINTPIQYVGDNTRFVKGAYEDLWDVLSGCQKLVQAAQDGSEVTSLIQQLQAAMEEADVEYLVEEIPAAIKQTLDGVQRVANIVRAMKEFAHPGVSEMTLTDLSAAVENTVMVARNEWKYVAELETQFDPTLPPVPCLPGELNQVLLNMIVNAAHAIGDSLGNTPERKGK
ncbi:MAG: hypothetical protein MI861_20585, partial [Pirellulales bacterium]|nr:hypothetical protein [Pirellulales bacterium]